MRFADRFPTKDLPPMTLTQEQQDEIKALREQSAPTRRAVAPGLEAILY